MSKENFEQFMKQVADSEELQAKIGKEITGDALVALGAAHGCEFSIEDVQASTELSDVELERVAGGAPHYQDYNGRPRFQWKKGHNKLIIGSFEPQD